MIPIEDLTDVTLVIEDTDEDDEDTDEAEMEKAQKIARMNILAQNNSTKTCISRHFAMRAKTA